MMFVVVVVVRDGAKYTAAACARIGGGGHRARDLDLYCLDSRIATIYALLLFRERERDRKWVICFVLSKARLQLGMVNCCGCAHS